MAAKSKKRLSKIENKLLKLEKLEITDVLCSICQSILVEPVTLPCYHDFCLRCFKGSIENNSLSCPLCRLRIGSWLRTATKQKNLVNLQLWDYIKNKFSYEIDKKLKGDDLNLPEEKPLLRLSAPGEIRLEYEAELKRLRSERLRLEQKHLAETELLIRKLQLEEEEAHKRYLECVKQDETFAKQLQEKLVETTASLVTNKETPKNTHIKSHLKTRRIEAYLSKFQAPIKESPILTDDNISNEGTTPKIATIKSSSRPSPEIIPNYGKLLKNFLDKKIKNGVGVWNKENGENCTKTLLPVEESNNKKESVTSQDKSDVKSKTMIQSLLVSLPLPYTGILHSKNNTTQNRHLETGSVDSMQQELCYFKPIDGSTPISFSSNKNYPLRVPSVRAVLEKTPLQQVTQPSRAEYLESLCRLRNISLAQKLPSAFVIALGILRVKKDTFTKADTRLRIEETAVTACVSPNESIKRNSNTNKHIANIDGVIKLNTEKSLRRTRSMGSIAKDENEVTPKKQLKDRKVSSDRKVYFRSKSKKLSVINEIDSDDSPPLVIETINNNNINLAVKNLSSPLENNCDVKNILREQLRIEKLIEQEKSDFELAQKMDAEWNGRRQLRRAASKRQVTLNYSLRPAKKLRV
ncbi:unnamed protein product [Parnassius apollo]|uniref:RING-type E3 ubiquitin transferase n=1 Tax=Parnassius apollo TaxID=110799 RepID=A0A8S3WJ18_PARAO|nr:unnamed protein product [Parnassius apollo]